MADGAITGSTNAYNIKLYATCDYILRYPLCNGSQYVVMNQEKWQSMPEDYQAIFTEEFEAAKTAHNEWMYEKCYAVIEEMCAGGMTAAEMTEEALAEFQALTADVIEDYKLWLGEQGYDADEVFRIAEEVIAGQKG